MHNIEEVHCNAAINAILEANLQLTHASVEEAVSFDEYGKCDTLGLDGIPEISIKTSLRNFDKGSVLITEEIGSTSLSAYYKQQTNQYHPPTFYLSDPTDRSAQLKEFLEGKDPTITVGEVIHQKDTIKVWEDHFGTPASITGASSAITCIRYGIPIVSTFVNFITQELFVAFRSGVYQLKLPSYKELRPSQITLQYIKNKGTPFYFRTFEESGKSLADMRNFVTFLGKSGYAENFSDSNIIPPKESEKHLVYDNPGGPSRVLYLSTIQSKTTPIGFILANGEKIGEWIHWLPFVIFGKMENDKSKNALHLYEISQERPWTKNGILMSTPPPYSIFSPVETQPGKMIIDVNKFSDFTNPSQIRSTLLAAPVSNLWATTVMERHLCRQIKFSDH